MSITMSLFLVRHAQAGHRSYGPQDESRTLSEGGEAQAQALVTALGDTTVTRLLSSPYARCRQTLGPLAVATGLDVEPTACLAEGMPFEPVLHLFGQLPEGAVLCSHGDVIPEVIDALIRRGLRVQGEPRWNKGAVWVLDRTADQWTTGRSFRL
jgi:8-oxo-dGTP diphosphatase